MTVVERIENTRDIVKSIRELALTVFLLICVVKMITKGLGIFF